MYVDLLPGEEVNAGSVIHVELENPEPLVCSIQGGCTSKILSLSLSLSLSLYCTRVCVVGCYFSCKDSGCSIDVK